MTVAMPVIVLDSDEETVAGPVIVVDSDDENLEAANSVGESEMNEDFEDFEDESEGEDLKSPPPAPPRAPPSPELAAPTPPPVPHDVPLPTRPTRGFEYSRANYPRRNPMQSFSDGEDDCEAKENEAKVEMEREWGWGWSLEALLPRDSEEQPAREFVRFFSFLRRWEPH